MALRLKRSYGRDKIRSIIKKWRDNRSKLTQDRMSFVGKLDWEGDGLEIQKELRNEWR